MFYRNDPCDKQESTQLPPAGSTLRQLRVQMLEDMQQEDSRIQDYSRASEVPDMLT